MQIKAFSIIGRYLPDVCAPLVRSLAALNFRLEIHSYMVLPLSLSTTALSYIAEFDQCKAKLN